MRRLAILMLFALIAASCGSDSGNAEAVDDGAGEEVEEVVEEAEDTDSETDSAEQDDTDDADTEASAEQEPAEEAPEEDESAEEEPAEEGARGLIGPPEVLDPDCSAVPSASVGLQTGTVTTAGFEYAFQMIVPSGYDGTAPIPVVLDFHGLGSNGAQQALFSGVAALAEAEGFLSVQPTGIPSPTDEERNSWELPQFDLPERDDVQMVVDMLDFISGQVCIDPGRVYSMGMSNGALFTSELVCDLSERIAGAVSVAGVTHDDSCEPSRAVPYLAFHGIDDDTVPFNGGGESSLGPDPFFEQVMPEEFSQFADDFGCASSEESVVTAEITLTSYIGCEDGVELGFYAIAGAGHTWPGSLVSSSIPSLGVTNTDIDATTVAWEFFEQQSLPGAIEVAIDPDDAVDETTEDTADEATDE